MMIKAPFSPHQVEALNEFQGNDRFHEFTCPGTHENCSGKRVLVATEAGWVCSCGDYTQDWAHDFMARGGLDEPGG